MSEMLVSKSQDELIVSLFEHMLNGIAFCKILYRDGHAIDFSYLYTNSAFHSQTGLGAVQNKLASEIIPKIQTTDPELIEIYARVAIGGRAEQFEMYIESLQQWFNISVFSPCSGHFISVFDVITQRKKSEVSLLKLMAMLARTERIAHIGSWDWYVPTDRVTWSDELFRIFQLNPANRAPSFEEQANLYHPEDFQRLRLAANRALLDGKPFEIELRVIRKDGRTRVCIGRVLAQMGHDSRVETLYGTLEDVTERRQTAL